jgi:methionyl-tRNA synthetase
VENQRFGQCKSWLKSGLQPRSMTRDLDWGINVPLEEADGKKLYVWIDAPIGYISATKQWAIDNNKDWQLYWKKQETRMMPACYILLVRIILCFTVLFSRYTACTWRIYIAAKCTG